MTELDGMNYIILIDSVFDVYQELLNFIKVIKNEKYDDNKEKEDMQIYEYHNFLF